MTTYHDPFANLPAPSDFEFKLEEARCARAETEHSQARLAQAEHRIERLETALTATIRALAFGETTYPGGHPEKHGLCGTETAEYLARAAQVLGLDLNDLGLAYAVTCPHGDDPALCNECRGIYDGP